MNNEILENQEATNFTADSTIGKINLNTFANKNVVLFFYPKDMTPGCTVEAQEFNNLYDEFTKIDTVIIGISRDNLSSHQKFIDKHELKFPLIADTDSKLCNLYGVLKEKVNFGRKYIGINRQTFLIGKDGVIKKIWHKVSPKGHAEKVLTTIKNAEN